MTTAQQWLQLGEQLRAAAEVTRLAEGRLNPGAGARMISDQVENLRRECETKAGIILVREARNAMAAEGKLL